MSEKLEVKTEESLVEQMEEKIRQMSRILFDHLGIKDLPWETRLAVAHCLRYFPQKPIAQERALEAMTRPTKARQEFAARKPPFPIIIMSELVLIIKCQLPDDQVEIARQKLGTIHMALRNQYGIRY